MGAACNPPEEAGREKAGAVEPKAGVVDGGVRLKPERVAAAPNAGVEETPKAGVEVAVVPKAGVEAAVVPKAGVEAALVPAAKAPNAGPEEAPKPAEPRPKVVLAPHAGAEEAAGAGEKAGAGDVDREKADAEEKAGADEKVGAGVALPEKSNAGMVAAEAEVAPAVPKVVAGALGNREEEAPVVMEKPGLEPQPVVAGGPLGLAAAEWGSAARAEARKARAAVRKGE